jgi:hypothetical protein
MVSVIAHHDARRGWEAFGPNSLVFGWLSMEGILACEKGHLHEEVHGTKLGRFWRSFGTKRGGDGMPEDRLNGLGRKKHIQTNPQSVEASCLA